MSFKGNLKLMLLDARGNPFPGRVTVDLKHTVLDRTRRLTVNPATIPVIENLESTPDGRYQVRCAAPGHHTVARFVQVLDGGTNVQAFTLPIKADGVRRPKFPDFRLLPDELKTLLQNSAVLGLEDKRGVALYKAMDDLQRAGLLNIHAKMRATRFLSGSSVASAMLSLTRLRGDRFFAKVTTALRDQVKNSILNGLFEEVSGSLHEPPLGYESADSFKTFDNFSNLQLTFFRKTDALEFLVDADLDDARGIKHAFQVLDHALTGGQTHPFDIHQLLLATQGVDPGYDLVV
jgi:hypothetical protein